MRRPAFAAALAAVCAALLTAQGDLSAQESASFRVGVHVLGGDFLYWAVPSGSGDSRDYARRAFREIRELGFDFVSVGRVRESDLGWIIEESETAGLDYVPEALPAGRAMAVEPFSITPESRSQPDRSAWLVRENLSADSLMDRVYRSAAASGSELWVFGAAWYNEVRDDERSNRWRVATDAMPTEGELRAQLWLAVACGAKAFGFLHYNSKDDAGALRAARLFGAAPPKTANDFTHREIGLYNVDGTPTALVEPVRRLIAEIRPLAPLIGSLQRQEDGPVPVLPAGSPLRARLFRHRQGGSRYLVIVNGDPDREQPAAVDPGDWSVGVAKIRRAPELAWVPLKQMKRWKLQPGGGAIVELAPAKK